MGGPPAAGGVGARTTPSLTSVREDAWKLELV